MSYAGAVFLVIGFIFFFKIFSVIEKARKVISEAKISISIIRNPSMLDEEKEVALQAHAKSLFISFFWITLGGASALFIPASIVWGGSQIGMINFDDVIETTLTLQFLLGSTIAVIFIFWLIGRREPEN